MAALRSWEDTSTDAPVGARPSRMAQRVETPSSMQPGKHHLGARVFTELDQGARHRARPRHGNGGIHGAAADMRGDFKRFGFAALLEQQEGIVGIHHAHALDLSLAMMAMVSIIAPPR